MTRRHMVSYSTWIVTTNYSCKCTCVSMWRKYVMVNEITRFGGLNFFGVILSEKNLNV